MLAHHFTRVNTGGPDQEGCLLFDGDSSLIAVLVRLSSLHEEGLSGKWFFEHGFGNLDNREHPIFDSIEQAEQWIASLNVI
jgi:hypothetical protein